MIRPLRLSDAPRYIDMLIGYFPEEEELLGGRREAYERFAHRLYRWDVRLALGFLALIRRPVFRAFCMEADGKLVATAVVTFTKRAGYIGAVMTDATYRRRGLAHRLVAECVRTAHSYGKPYAVLDVLSRNTPARALYDKMGFRALREQIVAVHDRPASRSDSPARLASIIRPFRRSDRQPLVEVARTVLAPGFVEILPPSARDYDLSSVLIRGLESDSAAWVIASNGVVNGFVRATKSEATEAGNLSAPLLARNVAPEAGVALVQTAVAWLAERHVPRIVTEYAAEDLAAGNALSSAGFHEVRRTWTLYRASDN